MLFCLFCDLLCMYCLSWQFDQTQWFDLNAQRVMNPARLPNSHGPLLQFIVTGWPKRVTYARMMSLCYCYEEEAGLCKKPPMNVVLKWTFPGSVVTCDSCISILTSPTCEWKKHQRLRGTDVDLPSTRSAISRSDGVRSSEGGHGLIVWDEDRRKGARQGGGLIPDSFGIISALYPWAYSQRSSTNQSHKENFLNFFFFFKFLYLLIL